MKYAILIIILSTSIGCMTAPNKDDYTTPECYERADCQWRNKDNPDKTICAGVAQACVDSLKERRRITRLEYCRDKKPADMTERECRSWMNEN